MKIKIKPRTWNNSITYEEEDSILYSSITEKITDNAAADTSKKSSLELEKSDIMLKENVISGSFVEVAEPAYNNIKEIVDFETISDISPVDDCVISSTPQNLTPPEGSLLSEYKPLNIPPDTKYIEMILCCNKNSTTSYAHLAENNDDMFSDVNTDEFITSYLSYLYLNRQYVFDSQILHNYSINILSGIAQLLYAV